MKHTTKKAQMEIIGLAVIVILLAIGMFFVAKFTLSEGKPKQVTATENREVASTFIATLLSSNAGCSNSATFTDLVESMADPYESALACGDYTTHFNNSVRSILNQTLDIWRYEYNLSILFPYSSGIEDFSVNKGCINTSNQETKEFYVPTRTRTTITVRMVVCY